MAVRRQLCPALEALIEHGSRLPSRRGKATGNSLDNSPGGVGSTLLSLLGCFSRNRLEGARGIGSGSGYDDSDDEADDDENGYFLESEEEREARAARRRQAQSSAWAIFLKYYVMTVSFLGVTHTSLPRITRLF